MDLNRTIMISASGMRAQRHRMRVIAENLANAGTEPLNVNEEPYRRKLVSFRNVLDRAVGVTLVQVARVRGDNAEFGLRYDPQHPGANADGYVRLPNVNALVEAMDMREAQRSYEANAMVIEAMKKMISRTIELIRS